MLHLSSHDKSQSIDTGWKRAATKIVFFIILSLRLKWRVIDRYFVYLPIGAQSITATMVKKYPLPPPEESAYLYPTGVSKPSDVRDSSVLSKNLDIGDIGGTPKHVREEYHCILPCKAKRQ